MKINTKELFAIEKDLIAKHKEFNKLKPKTIKIVDTKEFDGKATPKCLNVSESFLKTATKKSLINLLKHELCHYVLVNKGHNIEFVRLAKKVGSTIGRYENISLIEEGQRLGIVEEVKRKIIIKRRPNWELFFNDVFYNSDNHGVLFKYLRRYYNLSVKDVADKMSISVYAIRKIEREKNLYRRDEMFLKKVFQTITRSDKL